MFTMFNLAIFIKCLTQDHNLKITNFIFRKLIRSKQSNVKRGLIHKTIHHYSIINTAKDK